MELQFLFGNPKRKGRKKKGIAKHKRSSKIRASRKDMRKKRKVSKRRKIKNPAYHFIDKKSGKTVGRKLFPSQKQIGVAEGILAQHISAAKKIKLKEASLKAAAAKASGEEKTKLHHEHAAASAAHKRATKNIGTVAGLVKKIKSHVTEAKYQRGLAKGQGLKIRLQARTQADKVIDKLIQEAKLKKVEGISRAGSESYESKSPKGAVKVAKKKKSKKKSKRKASKKASAKRKAAKKASAKRKPSKKSSAKKTSKKAKKASSKKKRTSKKAKRASRKSSKKPKILTKAVGVFKKLRSMKKGSSKKLKVGKKKFVAVRTNPTGGSMADKKIPYTGHTVMEAGGLAVGGAVVAALNGLVSRFAPGVAGMIHSVPVVGPSLLPLAAGVGLNMLKNEYAQAVGKGIVGATVVKLAMDGTHKATGLGAIYSFQASGNQMGSLKQFAAGNVNADFNGLPITASAKDFGAEDIDYLADFNGVPERSLAGHSLDHDDGHDEDSLG